MENEAMMKKIILAAAVTGLIAGAAMPLHSSSAEAASGCLKAAKAKYATDHKSRVAYRKECRAHYKSYRAAQKTAKKTAG
jgi:hypothetical protein